MKRFYSLITGVLLFFLLYSQGYSADKEVTIRVPYNPALVEKKKDLTGTPIYIKVIIYKSYAALTKTYEANGGNASAALWGWQINLNGVCEIHVVEPKYIYHSRVMGTWGHELVHCVYGAFHN